MSLDRFKTQVLILHSEQSALDSLSSGFGNRYTVHCASSGSEALNTLGETPINVIVSAQELPGMSGLEALREAKKRSPDTIGILLAGDANRDLEALVGDEEVFKVVRGNVTGESLLKLVENATRQVRLMALAESANDTAANPDEPAEHIIMETSENGSTIISTGTTGRMPALDPEKISSAAASGARLVDILVITKDQEFLATIKDSSRGLHKVHYANTLTQADELIRKHKVGVAVVDAAMVGEKVEQLTQHLRKGSARLVSIVAGRRDDGEMLMDLINRGKVYRFLLKPVSPGRARLAVEASVKHHLEAPDAAFKQRHTPAAAAKRPTRSEQPTASPDVKPAPQPKAKARPKAQPKAEPKAKPGAKAATVAVAAPADPPLGEPNLASPVDAGLASAFGGDDSSFTETVTGLISAVSDKFAGKKEPAPAAPAKTAPRPEPAAKQAPTAPTGGAGGSPFTTAKTIGLATMVVAVIAAAIFWFAGGDEEIAPVEEPVAELRPSVTEADVDFSAPVQPGPDIQALVDEARLARDAGQVFNPAGSNAIELYAAAVAADPSNARVVAEFDAIIEQALGMAETALLESRLDDAGAALQRVALFDADNTRLPFLEAQLSQMQLRGHLADARAAIKDTRFEDAANSLSAARSLDIADASEIETVAEELSAARSAQRVDEVLALATARLDEGDLLSPANDNARYYYELVLSNDADNVAARQGLNVVANKLVLQARSDIDNGNLDAAGKLLADARAIDASSTELAATDVALANARDAIVQQQRRAAAARKAEAERQAAAKEEAERQAAAAEAKAEAERQAAAAEAKAEAERQAAAAEAKAEADRQTAAATIETEAGPAAVYGPETEAGPEIETATLAQQEATTPAPVDIRDQAPVAVSSLTRTRYVAPKYPRSAERRGQSGWVDIVFTVATDGTVKDLEVRKSQPDGVFDNAALRAVEKWRFEPVSEDGAAVERRAGVRMMFALE